MNFKAFRDKVFQLYNAAAYTEAMAFIDEHAAKFPMHVHGIYFWRACLSCRAGDAEAGLTWLQEASDQGYWYHETMLRDRDLSVLHDTGKLEPLQAVFQQRHAAAQAAARPELKVWSPSGSRRGLVLFLHGAGGNITDEEENRRWEPAVAAGWEVAFV